MEIALIKPTVHILADNIISSLGFDTAANIEKISAEQTGIQQQQDAALYPTPFWASKVDKTAFAKHQENITNAAAYSFLEQLFILSIQNILQQVDIDITQPDTLFIFASTKGNIDLLEHKNRDKFPLERVGLAEMATQVQNYFNNPNQPLVVCNACISGVLAMDVAKRLLQQNKYKHIIVTGGDLATEFTVSGFQSFKAMSEAPCKPYDKHRTGINLGEGVGTVLLSTAPPLGNETIIIKGGASSNDANHISGPSRTGDGLHIAMQKALQEANCTDEDIDYLSMHGTATPYNDEMESKAAALSNMSHIPMNSLKGYFGHTLGAAGLIESIVAIHSLKNNTLYRSLGFEELGVPMPLNVITKTTKKELNTCIKTASGFGGCNAAMVFQKIKK